MKKNTDQKRTASCRIISLGVAALLAALPIACKGSKTGVPKSHGEIVATCQDCTILDELADSGVIQFNENLNYIQAADLLERYIKIQSKIEKEVDLTNVEYLRPLSVTEKEKAYGLAISEIDTLIEASKYKGNDVINIEESLEAKKMLSHLLYVCTSFIERYGDEISKEYLRLAILSAIAPEFNIGNVYDIQLPDTNVEHETVIVKIDGKEYKVVHTIMRKAIEELNNPNSQEEKNDVITSRLNLACEVTAAGVNRNNGNSLTPENTKEIVKKLTGR